MGKLIGYARVSTRHQDAGRQELDLLEAGVRKDDLYIDHGVSGATASRPASDRALDSLQSGDTLVITTLDRLGRSTANMLGLIDDLRERGIALRVLTVFFADSLLLRLLSGLTKLETARHDRCSQQAGGRVH